MTVARYILIVASVYASTFVAMSFILGAWPPYPAYQTALMIIAGALFFAWAGTIRIQQIVGAEETEFTAASVFHAALVAILLGGAACIRFA